MCIIVKRDCLLTFSAHTSHVRVDAFEKKLWKKRGQWCMNAVFAHDLWCSRFRYDPLFFYLPLFPGSVSHVCLQLGRNTSLSSLDYSVRVLFTAGQKYVTFFPSLRWSTHAQLVCTPLGTKAVTTVHNFSTSPFCIIVHFILYASSWNSICTQYRFFFLSLWNSAVWKIWFYIYMSGWFTCLDDLQVNSLFLPLSLSVFRSTFGCM